MRVSPFASSAGLSGAAAAQVGDLASFHDNPAGLAHLKYPQISLQNVLYMEDVLFGSAAWARPTERGAWGVTGGLLTIRDLVGTRTDASSPDRYVETGSLRAGAQFLQASWARRRDRDFSAGVSLKALKEDLDTRSALSLAADAGMVLRSRLDPRWRFAAVVLDAGSPGTFDSQGALPPARAKLGLYHQPEEWAEWEVDLTHPLLGGMEVSMGGQFNWHEATFVRLGYRHRFEKNGLGALTGASMGLGAVFGAARVDYAFQPLGDLGAAHRLTVGWRLGAETPLLPDPDPSVRSGGRRKKPLSRDLP